MYLLHGFLFFLLINCCQFQTEGQCDHFSELVMTASCKPIINEYKEFQRDQRNKEVKDYKKMAALNKKIDTCLEINSCGEARRDHLKAEHEIVNYHVPNIMLCLKSFFRKSYQSQYLRDGSCYEKFHFLDSNLVRRRNALINGRSCFMHHLKHECHAPAIEFFSRENYKRLTKSFTTIPEVSICEAPFFYLEAVKCAAVFEEFTTRQHLMNKIANRAKNPYVLENISICKDLQHCNSNPCLSNNIGWDKTSLSTNCNLLESEYRK